MTSNTPEWSTPQDLFDELDREFHFTLDPCATPENAKCKAFFTIKQDGLKQAWGGVVFMNPPYGREIGKWVEKAYKAAQAGATVVCLLPARTDTRWWHDFVMKGEIRFIRGRLKFGGSKNSAPFPSAIVVFRSRPVRDRVRERRTGMDKALAVMYLEKLPPFSAFWPKHIQEIWWALFESLRDILLDETRLTAYELLNEEF